MAVLTVVDEGPGMPNDRLAHIFERYASFRDSRGDPAGPGTAHFGIGLWSYAGTSRRSGEPSRRRTGRVAASA